MKLTETYLRKVIKEEVQAVLQEGFMDKTLDFFGRKHPMGRPIRDRAREIRDNPKWYGSNLARTYGKKINQIIASGDNEAVTYADQLKDIEDQFKRQIDSEEELSAINDRTKESDQKRKDIFWNSIENKNKKDADKARSDKEFSAQMERDREERLRPRGGEYIMGRDGRVVQTWKPTARDAAKDR